MMQPKMSTNEQIVRQFFTRREDYPDFWTCKCGKHLSQKKGTGWSNLMYHVRSHHLEPTNSQENKQQSNQLLEQRLQILSQENKQQTLPKFATENPAKSFNVSRSVLNVYGWIEWVSVGLKPFSFVEEPLTRKYTNLGSMTKVALQKYMSELTLEVEKKISKELPEKFALVIDGWRDGSTYYVGLFASYPWNDGKRGYRIAMLSFSTLMDETSFSNADHVEFIEYMLSRYGKSFENIVAIIGDNSLTTQSMAILSGIPLLGCTANRFNTAVSAYLEKERILLDKTNNLMGKLKSYKLERKLRQLTQLKAIQRDITRCSTTFDMIERFIQIDMYLESFKDEPKMNEYLLTPWERIDLRNLEKNSKKLRSVIDALLREEIDLLDVRVLFDEILLFHQDVEFTTYLLPFSEIVHNPDFENGIVKILQKSEENLQPSETLALRKLELHETSENKDSSVGDEDDDFASNCLKKRRLNLNSNVSKKYIDCRFILPTSNILERFCYSSGYSLDDFRQNISSLDLEIQLFLKANRSYWDEDLVSKIINNQS